MPSLKGHFSWVICDGLLIIAFTDDSTVSLLPQWGERPTSNGKQLVKSEIYTLQLLPEEEEKCSHNNSKKEQCKPCGIKFIIIHHRHYFTLDCHWWKVHSLHLAFGPLFLLQVGCKISPFVLTFGLRIKERFFWGGECMNIFILNLIIIKRSRESQQDWDPSDQMIAAISGSWNRGMVEGCMREIVCSLFTGKQKNWKW